MSSRFVSGGTLDATAGESSSAPPPLASTFDEKARQSDTKTPVAPSATELQPAVAIDRPSAGQQYAALPDVENATDATLGANRSRLREKVTWGGEAAGTPKEETHSDTTTTNLNPEWAAAQAELEEQRRRRAEERERAAKGEEKSLYEVLQANKAAKQAAFEEATKLKNQFRPLDDDEIDFLDEVAAKKKQEEERVRRETAEGLNKFHQLQQDAAKQKKVEDEMDTKVEWSSVGRKRKRDKERAGGGLIKGLKIRGAGVGKEEKKDIGNEDGNRMEMKQVPKPTPKEPPKKKVQLVSYGSDSDSE